MTRAFFLALVIAWPVYGLATGHWWESSHTKQEDQTCEVNGLESFYPAGDTPPAGAACVPAFGSSQP